MTALIKYGVGGIIMVVLLGCQPTSTPTASVPSVTAEQFATPSSSPTATPTDAQMLPRSSTTQTTASADTVPPAATPVIVNPEEVVGTYTCQTLVFKPADPLTMNEDGTYKLGELTGKYSRETDTKLTWIDGEMGLKYQRTSVFVFYAKPPAINLVSLGNDHRLDLICKRNEKPSDNSSAENP